jgi:drug/metabolite transporter (DMT)-like permease
MARPLSQARLNMDRLVVKEIPISPTQIACAVLVPLFWGVQFVVIKVGLTAFPPLFFVGLRFAAQAMVACRSFCCTVGHKHHGLGAG